MRCFIDIIRHKYAAICVTLNGMPSLCSGHLQGKLIPSCSACALENIIPPILALTNLNTKRSPCANCTPAVQAAPLLRRSRAR